MTTWFVAATPADIDRLRHDPGFAEALTLGRISNLLRAVIYAGFEHGPKDGTASERQRTAMFLLLTGLLAEALPALERCGQHFRGLKAHDEHIRPILADPSVATLRASLLKPLRNQAVFHNDVVVSARGLELMAPPDPQDLARGSSASLMDVYHPLGDFVALSYVLDAAGGAANPAAWLSANVRSSLDLGSRIAFAVDALLGEALAARGFEWDERVDTAG